MEEYKYSIIQKILNDEILMLKLVKKKIKILDNKYKNKLIHISFSGKLLTINSLENTNKKYKSRYIHDNSNIYQNPYGLWLSCGASWLKYTVLKKKYSYAKSKYIYEVKLYDENILYINNLDELINFHEKYAIYDKNKGYNINWRKVKKTYDGLIICPYLGYQIWSKNNITKKIYPVHITSNESKYIKNGLKENIMKYPYFYLEWYKHWDVASGVIWRKKSVKEINLINF